MRSFSTRGRLFHIFHIPIVDNLSDTTVIANIFRRNNGLGR